MARLSLATEERCTANIADILRIFNPPSAFGYIIADEVVWKYGFRMPFPSHCNAIRMGLAECSIRARGSRSPTTPQSIHFMPGNMGDTSGLLWGLRVWQMANCYGFEMTCKEFFSCTPLVWPCLALEGSVRRSPDVHFLFFIDLDLRIPIGLGIDLRYPYPSLSPSPLTG